MNEHVEGPTTPRFQVFGGIGVDGSDGPVSIGGPRQRRLLALLVVRTGATVGIDWLSENLWRDDERPDDDASTIRTYIARLRRSLPDEAQAWVETAPSGYRFAAPRDAVEHLRVEDLRSRALLAREHDDPQIALGLLDEGLSISRGAPFRELEDLDWMRAEIERIELDRLEMMEERWEAALALGRHTQITGELAAFTTDHGHRDRAVRQYALALHRSGRTPEALRTIADHRRLLAEGSGLEPSSAIVELEQALLAGDPSLDVDTVGRPLRGYRLLEEAGTGAFSVVWRGVQPSVDREVAIKQIRAELASRPEFIRRFEAEAHLVARIEHPHIVPLIDYWRDPDSAYLVMRWLSGGTLERRLDDGPMTVAETLTMARQVGDALSAAHAHGVVHRDVKPANILFDAASNAFLGDFGIALEAIESAGPEAALSPGSPVYASPEQIRRELLGAEADVFSLGVVLFECLAGSVPFPDSSSAEQSVDAQLNDSFPPLGALRDDIPDAVSDAVARATAKDPNERFSTVRDFLAALEPLASIGWADPAGEPVSERAHVDLDNPYVGLRAFDDGDVDRFFGRERLVDEFVARLSGDSIGSRCLFVVGPSGSGKSSVVRAGLVPALRRGAVPGSADWFTTAMVPGADPFEALEAALLRIAVNPPTTLLDQLRDGPRGVLRGVRRCLPTDADRVVIVLDQFEEVFINSSPDEADALLTALAVAVEDPATQLRLVVTMRADYYDRPLEHPAFAPIVKKTAIEVTPLAADELERATTAPAAAVGIEFEPGLVARVLAETVGQPSPLPLLQYTLSELFDRRPVEGRTLTTDAYDQIGGVSGALSLRAERLYTDADEARRTAIRRMFGRLTSPVEDAADVRRRVPIADLGADASMVVAVEQFTAARLLTVGRDVTTREPTVEVAHEALLREWTRLAGWLEEDRELLRTIDSIASAATAWNEGGRQVSDLYRGVRLDDASDVRLAEPDRLRPLDREFIETSKEQAVRERDDEQRRLRRLRRLVVATAAALVVALIAGGVALNQQRRADDQAEAAELAASDAEQQAAAAVVAAEEADVATLTSRSAALTSESPDVAVLLALEAHRRAPEPETEGAVLNALGSSSIARRATSFEPLDIDSCSMFTIIESSGLNEFGVLDGQLIARDLTTGVVTDHGPAPAECVLWRGDAALDARWATSLDARTMWFGTFDGPWTERDFAEGTFPVKSAFSPSGRLFFFGPDSGSVIVLDDETGDIVTVVEEGGDFIGLDVSPDGQYFAIGYGIRDGAEGDGLTIVFDAATGGEIFRVATPLPAERLVFDTAADELILGIIDGSVTTIDLETGTIVRTIPSGVASGFVDMELVRPDGLLTVVTPGQLQLVDRRTGPVGAPVELRGVASAWIRPDGSVLASEDDARFNVIEFEGNALVEQRHDVEPFAEVGIADGIAVAVAPPDGAAVIVDLDTGDPTALQLPEGEDFSPVFASPYDDGVVAIDDQHVVALFQGGEVVDRIDLGGITVVGAVDGDHFAVLGDQPDGTRVANLVQLAPDGLEVAFTVLAPSATSVRPSPDGGLYAFNRDGRLVVFDSAGEQVDNVKVGEIGDDGALVTAIDHASGSLAVADPRGGVTIVDPHTAALDALPGNDLVAGLGFVRDGELLVITRFDGSVRLWDVERRQDVGVIAGGSGAKLLAPVWYDASTDSVWLSTSGSLVRVSLDPQRWVERACEIVNRDLTAEEWDRFVPGDTPPQPACD